MKPIQGNHRARLWGQWVEHPAWRVRCSVEILGVNGGFGVAQIIVCRISAAEVKNGATGSQRGAAERGGRARCERAHRARLGGGSGALDDEQWRAGALAAADQVPRAGL